MKIHSVDFGGRGWIGYHPYCGAFKKVTDSYNKHGTLYHAKTYCKLRNSAPSEATRKHIDALLGILGNLLRAQLRIYKS